MIFIFEFLMILIDRIVLKASICLRNLIKIWCHVCCTMRSEIPIAGVKPMDVECISYLFNILKNIM